MLAYIHNSIEIRAIFVCLYIYRNIEGYVLLFSYVMFICCIVPVPLSIFLDFHEIIVECDVLIGNTYFNVSVHSTPL